MSLGDEFVANAGRAREQAPQGLIFQVRVAVA